MSEKSPMRLDETDRFDWDGSRDRILNLYAQRHSIATIARLVGLSNATVSKILHNEFQERYKSRQEVVEAHRQTLQWMIQKVTKRIEEAKAVWDRRDAELLLKYLERESKAYGTDEPTKHEVNVIHEEMSEEDLQSELAAHGLTLQLAPPPPAPPTPLQIDDAEYEPASSEGPAAEVAGTEARPDSPAE